MELAFECDLVWNDFDGESDTRRRCGQCDRNVYNISNMTRAHAQRVVELHRERGICVHFVRRDGRVVHQGDPLEQLRAQRFGVRRLVAVALAAHAGFLMFSDDPGEHFFDPFAAAADVVDAFPDTVEEKFEEANASVVSGGVMF